MSEVHDLSRRRTGVCQPRTERVPQCVEVDLPGIDAEGNFGRFQVESD